MLNGFSTRVHMGGLNKHSLSRGRARRNTAAIQCRARRATQPAPPRTRLRRMSRTTPEESLAKPGIKCYLAVLAVGIRPGNGQGDDWVQRGANGTRGAALQADLDAFGDCMAGPDVSVGPGCEPADQDTDGDADLADFSGLQRG